MRRLAKILLAVFVVGALGALGAGAALSRPRPEGVVGPEAEALAAAMLAAVDADAWAATGAVKWTFAGRNQHLWDRRRQLARVRWGGVTVLVDLTKQTGRAWRAEEELGGRRAEKYVKKAYAAWINDSFWLNPVVKINDAGVTRALVAIEDDDAPARGLLADYSAGGLTPGDAYLWILDADDRPIAWRMWVSVIPIGGLRASWEGWTRLPTGAWVSTSHKLGPATLSLTDVDAAATLSELEPGEDPFAPLLGG